MSIGSGCPMSQHVPRATVDVNMNTLREAKELSLKVIDAVGVSDIGFIGCDDSPGSVTCELKISDRRIIKFSMATADDESVSYSAAQISQHLIEHIKNIAVISAKGAATTVGNIVEKKVGIAVLIRKNKVFPQMLFAFFEQSGDGCDRVVVTISCKQIISQTSGDLAKTILHNYSQQLDSQTSLRDWLDKVEKVYPVTQIY